MKLPASEAAPITAAESQQILAIGLLAVASATAGGIVVSTYPGTEVRPAAVNAVAESVGLSDNVAQKLQTIQAQVELARQATARVPVGVYSVALTLTNGNPVHANKLLKDKNLPPVAPEVLVELSAQLNITPPTVSQQAQANAEYLAWQARLDDTDIAYLPSADRALQTMYNSLAQTDEVAARQRLLRVFNAEYRQNVREQLDASGRPCNCGPRIDVYTDNRPEAWCLDFVSWVAKEAGLPLSGGSQYGRADWQLPRVHTNVNSPELISGQAWFQRHATYFESGERLPEPGDVAFMKYPGRNGRFDDANAQWHVMFVLDIVDGNQVKLGGGNTRDAIALETLPSDSPNLVGYGSFFK